MAVECGGPPTLIDDVLTTTRAVRLRLDFDRPVQRDLVEECARLAFQAPTGSNGEEWTWIFVDDPGTRERLGELYRAGMADAGSKHSVTLGAASRMSTRSGESTLYLAENIQRAPALLVPTITRKYPADAFGTYEQASRWGSLLPAVWSFHLALRSRGMGSAWTTVSLQREVEVAELLGIPHELHMQGGLFPIAYTKGLAFHPVDRSLSNQRIGWNRWPDGAA